MSLGKYRKVKTFFYSNTKKVAEIDKDGNERVFGNFIIKSCWKFNRRNSQT